MRQAMREDYLRVVISSSEPSSPMIMYRLGFIVRRAEVMD
jgi:hypothetical protein